MNFKKIDELRKIAAEKMDDGDFNEALNIADKIRELGSHHILSFIASGIYIDLGTAIFNEDIVRDGIKILENDFEKIIKIKKQAPAAYYNRANGYSSLFTFKSLKDPFFHLFKESELDKAINNFKIALTYKINDNVFASKIWINLGNCYDSCGRVLDALQCYEKAIELFSEHGMAIGNKGIALYTYSNLVAEHEVTYLLEAYNLISKALKLGVNYEAKEIFLTYLNGIKKLIKDTEILESEPQYPGYEIEANTDFEKFFIDFILENELYLNICIFCKKCNACIGDTVLVKKMTMSFEEDLFDNTFLQLSSYLNQIKQDYISARFLLILGVYEKNNLNFVDKRVKIIDTLDGSVYNIYVQLIKISFKMFYDILDKLASLMNDYLSLRVPERQLAFHRIWYSNKNELRKKIYRSNNLALNALYKIHKDFDDGDYRNLREIRNSLTHRFLKIKKAPLKENIKNITKKTLIAQTVKLSKIVRNAIIYLIYFIDMEERKKESNEKRLSIIAKEIPDEDKY